MSQKVVIPKILLCKEGFTLPASTDVEILQQKKKTALEEFKLRL